MLSSFANAGRRQAAGQVRRMCGKAEGGGNNAAVIGAVGAAVAVGGAYASGMFDSAGALPAGMPKTGDATFDAWVQKMAAATPADPRDTADFKFINFTEKPPFTPKHKSLMARHLTDEIWNKYKDVKTKKGYTFSNAIQAGVLRPHLGVGITMGDEECFEAFKDIVNPVVKGWHGFDPATQYHKSDLNWKSLKFSKEQQKKFDQYVVSTRVRAARNISTFSLPPGSDEKDRLGVESVLKQAFVSFSGELAGKYYPLGSLSKSDEDALQASGFLFQKPGPAQLLGAAGAARSWPDGRGIFHNDKKTALAWCNEEDHCRIISMQNGGDIKQVFERFCNISNSIKAAAKANKADLMYSDRLGFLGTCPSNLGTGLRASVMIKLPELNKDPHKLEEICNQFDLQPRGSSGEHSAAIGAKWDISNKQRIGFSEVQLVQKMIDGVSKVIAIEEQMATGMTAEEALKAVK